MSAKPKQKDDSSNLELKDFYNSLIVSRYDSTEPLSSIEKKIITRIDIELTYKDPTTNFVVSGIKNDKYSMNYVSGSVTISKECKDKETCFKTLRSFILSLREIPL